MSAPTSWRTALPKATDEEVRIRCYDLRDLVGRVSFAEGILLMARGELPTELLEAILVSALDRGIVRCSVVTRYLASSGSPIQAAVTGGILSFGDVYGGAGEQLAEALANNIGAARDGRISRQEAAQRVVAHFTDRGLRVPGYGSAVHQEMTRESGWRHVPNAEVVYDGPPARPLPQRRGGGS
jgi:citrate synthase